MNDPVLRVLASRQALVDEGASRGLWLSGAAHFLILLAAAVATILVPKQPLIRVAIGEAIPLPKGGGVAKTAAPVEKAAEPAPEKAPVVPDKAPTKAAPAPLLKPPKEVAKKGVAPVELKRSVKESKPENRDIATEKPVASKAAQAAAAPTPGQATETTGFEFDFQQPGVSDGLANVSGPLAFYLAAAKNKIWASWARQIRPDFTGNVKVTFTIHRDGSIDGIGIVESSGVATIDRLAERTLLSIQLGPLPNSYDKETLVVHANFKPVS